MLNIESIKQFYNDGKIRWTNHSLERMGSRDISIDDITNCINYGEIIEDYPDDFPNPSCLIFGNDLENKYLHVIIGMDNEYVYVL